MGQAGMPDAIRITVEGFGARPQTTARSRASATRYGGCGATSARVGIAAIALAALPFAAAATEDAPPEVSTVDAYLSAFALLDRHELAALALTLGILCFAVVTAILLVRTRTRLAEVEAVARDESIAAKAAIDRFKGLILSEPQVLIGWEI